MLCSGASGLAVLIADKPERAWRLFAILIRNNDG